MKKAFYVTTPIYYVNASPHLGHAYTTIMADVMARYYRMSGFTAFFLTGTDEHGDKVAEAAHKVGETPQKYTDRISSQFRELWPQLNITNDYFIRTTDGNHKETVRAILQKVYDQGDIYFGEYEGFYCVGCERFYRESELVGGKCPDHQTVPEHRKESNYFFRMSRYQDWLIQHITDNPDFIRPERYRNEALAFLREPLEDLCISRPKTRLTWGITLPFDEKYVTYVWFDALINYLTGIGYPDSESFKTFWPAAQHLVAKDILKPHGIYWPTMLKAAGVEPYRHLNVHGYWNIDQGKMSKSRGTVIRPLELKDKYGLDAFRYYLMREMVFGLDSNFSEESFVQRTNSDLANDLGNLVNRSLSMAAKYCGGRAPSPAGGRAESDRDLVAKGESLLAETVRCFENLQFHRILQTVWEFINMTNKYIVEQEPWVLARDSASFDRLNTVIYNILEALRFISVFLTPFMPGTAVEMLRRLGVKDGEARNFEKVKTWGGLAPGSVIDRGEPLFPRVECNLAEADAAGLRDLKEEISIEEFQKIDMRAGTVLAAERVPKSDKLIKITVDVGEERTIVAGIGGDYDPSVLVGMQIAVVVNLKPAKIRGIESRGMLLATNKDKGLALVSFDGMVAKGSPIR
ncbi:MAG: methionine--tRNA ligase [Deltaproteobacteria bacterium]|nr:methionine--tRNA ligase [Deltaproteobacteria bacterium]